MNQKMIHGAFVKWNAPPAQPIILDLQDYILKVIQLPERNVMLQELL